MFFLKKIRTNSECQFKSDFGEYPPKPLEPMKVNTQFDILSKGTVGIIFYRLATYSSFFYLTCIGKPPLNSNSVAMTMLGNQMAESRKEFRKIILKIKTTSTSFKNSPFQIQFILFIIIGIAISPFALLFLIYQTIPSFINVLKKVTKHSSYGFFLQLTNRSSKVVINTSAIKRSKNSSDKLVRTMSFESIVSHEHIHL
ncbi:uncharacterized protein METZ01_LOCUS432699, partial [marine metagenome]